jgi:hypothetical protein
METELLQAYRLIVDAHETALKSGHKWGLCDEIDNAGNPYPSQWGRDILRLARAAVDTADKVMSVEELLAPAAAGERE